MWQTADHLFCFGFFIRWEIRSTGRQYWNFKKNMANSIYSRFIFVYLKMMLSTSCFFFLSRVSCIDVDADIKLYQAGLWFCQPSIMKSVKGIGVEKICKRTVRMTSHGIKLLYLFKLL